MITVLEQPIKDIPSLIVVKREHEAKPLPTVVYFHGFTSAKEHNLPFAFLLAQRDFRVILPDAMLHGARQEDISEQQFQLSFWEIVLKNIDELLVIKTELEKKKILLEGKIGVAGTSMGGITTSAALRKYPWIRAAAILMGSPKMVVFADELMSVYEREHGEKLDKREFQELFDTLEKFDLSKEPSVLQDRPLFIWHGTGDTVVPFQHSHSFYEQAKSYYEKKDLIRFSKEEGRGHKVSRSAILNTVSWFEKHLKT